MNKKLVLFEIKIMAWDIVRILVFLAAVIRVSFNEDTTSIRKCRIVGDDTVVCTVQRKEPSTSNLDDYDDDDSSDSEDDELSERSSPRWSVRRREMQRKNKQKCYVAASTIQCDGGMKLPRLGALGRPGSPGLPGPKVGKGDKGYRGSPGRPGPDGEEGPRGFRGRKGDAGSRGENGEKGDPGREGQQGHPGTPSNCKMLSYSPLSCSKGERGKTGLKGSIGEEGRVGDKGNKGKQGAKGNKGARGEAGLPGTIGLYGALRLKQPCRQLYSPWVVPYGSPIGKLKTECAFREYLLSLEIEPHGKTGKIRYNYKCCPFVAADVGRTSLF